MYLLKGIGVVLTNDGAEQSLVDRWTCAAGSLSESKLFAAAG